MEKAFQLPLSTYVDEFLEQPSPGDRLRGYAELAFANEGQIQTLRKQDRQTMVMSRRLMAMGQGPGSELSQHLNDVTGDYVRTRTATQFKWLIHSFALSGRAWIREFGCSQGREWVEEVINLLFVQRAFSSTPEEAEEYRMTRETLLRLTGPFPVRESGNEASDPNPVTSESFPWCPREDGTMNFRIVPSLYIPTVARVLPTLDFSAGAFEETGRSVPPRLQDLTRQTCERLKTSLQTKYPRPIVMAFIGA